MNAMRAWWTSDLRLALRGMGRAKSFYAAAILTLAIGMAGATVMFTLIRGIVLRPLPVPDEDRLVVSWRMPPDGPTHVPYRASDVEEIGRATRRFARVAGAGYNGAFEHVWADGGTAFSARTAVVMGDFFAVTGATPLLGRALAADDDREGAERVVVLSHAAWQRFFSGAAAIVGRRLVSRGSVFVIVGVMPPDFEYPRGVELWTSRWALASAEQNPAFRTSVLRDVEIVARLRPEVSPAQAADELATLMADLDARAAGEGFRSFRPVVWRFKDVILGDIDRTLAVLFAAVGLLLLIASANVANLLLMRGEARRTEFVMRAALGAGRSELIRQPLTESLVVTACATVAALVVSSWGLEAGDDPRARRSAADRVGPGRYGRRGVRHRARVRRGRRGRHGPGPGRPVTRFGHRPASRQPKRPRRCPTGRPPCSRGDTGSTGRGNRGRGRSADSKPSAAAGRRHGARRRAARARRARRAERALWQPRTPAPVPGRGARPSAGRSRDRRCHADQQPAVRRGDGLGCAAVRG